MRPRNRAERRALVRKRKRLGNVKGQVGVRQVRYKILDKHGNDVTAARVRRRDDT